MFMRTVARSVAIALLQPSDVAQVKFRLGRSLCKKKSRLSTDAGHPLASRSVPASIETVHVRTHCRLKNMAKIIFFLARPSHLSPPPSLMNPSFTPLFITSCSREILMNSSGLASRSHFNVSSRSVRVRVSGAKTTGAAPSKTWNVRNSPATPLPGSPNSALHFILREPLLK